MKYKYKILSLLLIFALAVTTAPIKVEAASTPAKVKSVKVKNVKKYYKGWLGEGNKKTKVAYDCLELSWKKVKGASGYEIYRYGNASKVWHKIKTITKGKTTKYILPEMLKGYKVKIKVVAYKKKSSGKVYGKESKILSFTPKKEYWLKGIIKTKNYNPIDPVGHYRFMGEDAFVIQNKYRTEKGIAPLEWDESLYEMSKIRTKELDRKYSHMRPNGHTSQTVANDYYNKNIIDNIPSLFNKLRENIAWGQPTPKKAMSAWKNSPGHYDALKMKNLKYGAISVYLGKNDYSWQSMFSEPKLDEVANSIEN